MTQESSSNSDEFMRQLQAEMGTIAQHTDNLRIKLHEKLAEEANAAVAKQREMTDLLERAKALQEQIQVAVQKTLPDLMHELELHDFTTEDGTCISLKPYFRASVPVKDLRAREDALAWIRENVPDIIKVELVLSYGAMQHDVALATKELLESLDLRPVLLEDVHHSTLTAYIRDRVTNPKEGDEPLPLKTLNASMGTVADIKLTDPAFNSRARALKNMKANYITIPA
jgi:hypothetical protein